MEILLFVILPPKWWRVYRNGLRPPVTVLYQSKSVGAASFILFYFIFYLFIFFFGGGGGVEGGLGWGAGAWGRVDG